MTEDTKLQSLDIFLALVTKYFPVGYFSGCEPSLLFLIVREKDLHGYTQDHLLLHEDDDEDCSRLLDVACKFNFQGYVTVYDN